MAKKGGASNDKKANEKGGKGKGKAATSEVAETEGKGKVRSPVRGISDVCATAWRTMFLIVG